jgi:hypothetical protein
MRGAEGSEHYYLALRVCTVRADMEEQGNAVERVQRP